MVSKRDRDAESGLQVMTVITIIWAIGFLYWSRGGTILGYDAGNIASICCSAVAVIMPVIFTATWLHVRKENRVKRYLDGYIITADFVSVDEISVKFGMKRATSIMVLRSWMKNSGIEGDYDETTGIFKKKMN